MNLSELENWTLFMKWWMINTVSLPCKENPEIIIFRFKAVLFGMSCSLFCLNAILDYHIKQYYMENTEMAEKILQGFYIDDWTCGGASPEEAFALFRKVKTCLTAGGFNL